MRKIFDAKRLLLGSLALFLSYSAIYANQVWYESTTPDVVDENLTISGNCQLYSENGTYDYVRITATSQSIDVYLSPTASGPIIVEGTGNVRTLFLEPIGGDITFHVDHNLKFTGADPLHGGQPLLIAVRGGKKVIFVLSGKNIAFVPV